MPADDYDFMEMLVAPPEGAICDLCSSPDVHWSYPCRDHAQKTEHFTALGLREDGSPAVEKMAIDGFSRGGWAACNPCHALIERGDRDRLARRSAKRMLKKQNLVGVMSLSDAIAHIRRIQDQFWSHREGPPIYHDERPTKDPTR